MAEATAPSPPQTRRPFEPSVFLRVCQSPWNSPTQISPDFARGAIAAYFTVVLHFLPVISELHAEQENQILFYGSYLSFMLQVIYYWTSFVLSIFRYKQR